MPRQPNTAGYGSKDAWRKTADKQHPHAIFKCGRYGIEWRVLKAYKTPGGEKKDRFSRWFCFVTSPMCPNGEYGDVWVTEIPGAELGYRGNGNAAS